MLNKTIKNIMSNYIPHEIVICDDRDPPWINKDIKQQILNRTFNCHNPIGIKLVTRLRLGSNHLRDHEFKHNFLLKSNLLLWLRHRDYCSLSPSLPNFFI